MALTLGRSSSPGERPKFPSEKIDLDVMRQEYGDDVKRSDELQEDADQLEVEKRTIEIIVDQLHETNLGDDEKEKVLKFLREDLEAVQQEFQGVTEEQDEIDQRQQERLGLAAEAMATYQDEIAEMEKQASEIEVAPVDFQEAISGAQDRVREFESFAEDAQQTISEKREKSLDQRLRMLGF